MPVISTNTAANSALRYLNLNSMDQSSSLTKLASGSRITKASDDAAGLAIGTSLAYDVQLSSGSRITKASDAAAGLTVGTSPAYDVQLSSFALNASHASAVSQIADGGLANISDILQRMKSLATESASGRVTGTERKYIQEEFGELTKQITSVADATRYNNKSLLNNSDTLSFKVGANQNDTVSFTLADVSAAGLSVDKLNASSQQSSQDALKGINSAIDRINGVRSYVGSKMSDLDNRSESISTTMKNTAAANSVVVDADSASAKASLSSQKVISQAAVASLAQANQMPQGLLGLLR